MTYSFRQWVQFFALCLILTPVSCSFQQSREKLQEKLFMAAQIGHTALMQHLIGEGADLRWTDRTGNTALAVAASHGHWRTVEAFLNDAAAVQSKDSHGNTLLHTAAFLGNVKEIELLVKAGIPVDSRNLANSTPLHLAADADQIKAAETLLQLGAKINAQNAAKETPLYVAAWRGNVGIFKFLLTKKANKTLRPVNSESIEKYVEKGDHPNFKLVFTEAIRRIN